MKEGNSFLLLTSNLGLGGAQRNVALMANELSKNNSVIVLTYANDENLQCLKKNIKIIQCNSNLLTFIQRLFMLVLTANLTHTIIFNYTFLFAIPIFYFKSKVYLRFINNYKLQKKSRLRGIYYAIGIYFTRPMITCYVAQCESMEKEMRAKLGRSVKIKVLFNPIVRRNLKKTEKEVDFIFVGKLTDQKDPIAALDELARYREKYDTFKAIFVGDGYLRDKFLDKLDKLELSNEVTWYNRHDCASDLISTAKVLLLTSRYEGFPNVVLEAVASHVPTVAYMSHHGITEIITDPGLGFICDPLSLRTTDDFVDQLNVFRYKKINAAIYDKKLDSFSIGRYSEQLRNIFD